MAQKTKERENLTLRLGTEGCKSADDLTKQANYEKPNQFFKALTAQLVEITGGKPFDVRDLTLSGRGGS